jgi:hypothetical protein
MRSQNVLNDRFETQDIRVANPEVSDGLKIEEILQRAREIHRERGGVFEYDFEDWLQAWRELTERGSQRASEHIEANGAGSMRMHMIRSGDASSSSILPASR